MSESEKNPDPVATGPLNWRFKPPDLVRDESPQQFDWGYVRWIVEPTRATEGRVAVGEVVFQPHQGEWEHYHFSEEQVLYIVSGRGYHSVNGLVSPVKQGDIKYISPYCRHTMANDSDDELRLLAFYIPSRQHPYLEELASASGEPETGYDLMSLLDFSVVEKLLSRLSQVLKMSFRLLSAEGDILIQSDAPGASLCRLMGREHCRDRLKLAISGLRGWEASWRTCCGRVSSIIIPIVSENVVRGFIKCGEFFINPRDRSEMTQYLRRLAPSHDFLTPPGIEKLAGEIPTEKKSRLFAAAESTMAVAQYLADSSLVMARQKELDLSRLASIQNQMASAKLEKALRDADFMILQSQINPHFLFNTLNTISQIAYMEGAEKAAGLVCSLSDLLRATLKKTKSLIPLREEISLLKNYLEIQKARFGARLEVKLEADEDALSVLIPGLILQPLVENAIIHAVEPRLSPGRILIRVQKKSDRVFMEVIDNGSGIQPRSADSGGLGLQNVEGRLRHCFRDCFRFELDSRPGLGLTVRIDIPADGGEG